MGFFRTQSACWRGFFRTPVLRPQACLWAPGRPMPAPGRGPPLSGPGAGAAASPLPACGAGVAASPLPACGPQGAPSLPHSPPIGARGGAPARPGLLVGPKAVCLLWGSSEPRSPAWDSCALPPSRSPGGGARSLRAPRRGRVSLQEGPGASHPAKSLRAASSRSPGPGAGAQDGSPEGASLLWVPCGRAPKPSWAGRPIARPPVPEPAVVAQGGRAGQAPAASARR